MVTIELKDGRKVVSEIAWDTTIDSIEEFALLCARGGMFRIIINGCSTPWMCE